MPKQCILVLEESAHMQQIIRNLLQTQGYSTQSLFTHYHLNTHLLDSNKYSVFVFNHDFLPKIFPENIIEGPDVPTYPPTLTITRKADTRANIEALNRGVDDCLEFPFHTDVFLARIKALSRRSRVIHPTKSRIGSFEIDRDSNFIRYKTKDINISKTEFFILSMLLENPNRTITKDEMLRRIWVGAKAPGINTVDAHISNIRSKLGDKEKQVIKTIHGFGYRLETPQINTKQLKLDLR